MKYNGIELNEFTSDKPVVFDPPKKILVWDDSSDIPKEKIVFAYLPELRYPVITDGPKYSRCAELPELPEPPKPRRATNRELAKWLAQGNGAVKYADGCLVYAYVDGLATDNINDVCASELVVRKWDDEEWHEPTADYMGLE